MKQYFWSPSLTRVALVCCHRTSSVDPLIVCQNCVAMNRGNWILNCLILVLFVYLPNIFLLYFDYDVEIPS